MAGGRPSKLTEEVRTKLLNALTSGNCIEPACAYAGISYQCLRGWMIKGEKAQKGEYFEFFQEVQRAIAKAELASVAKIKKAEEQDWKAAAWILERRHPDRWANTQRVKVEVEKELEKVLDAVRVKLSPELYAQVLSAIVGEEDSEEEAG